MPIEIFTCKICGASVTKRKSLFVSSLNGRVCKEHEEELKELEKKEVKDIEKKVFDIYNKSFDEICRIGETTPFFRKTLINDIIRKNTSEEDAKLFRDKKVNHLYGSDFYNRFERATRIVAGKALLEWKNKQLFQKYFEKEYEFFYNPKDKTITAKDIEKVFIIDENDLNAKVQRDFFIKNAIIVVLRKAWSKLGEDIAEEICSGSEFVNVFINNHPNEEVTKFFANHSDIVKEIIDGVEKEGILTTVEMMKSIAMYTQFAQRYKNK